MNTPTQCPNCKQGIKTNGFSMIGKCEVCGGTGWCDKEKINEIDNYSDSDSGSDETLPVQSEALDMD